MGSLLAIPTAVAAAVTALATEGLLYWIYYAIAYTFLKITRKIWRRRLDIYDHHVDGYPEKTGFLVPHQEYELDTPQETVSLRTSNDDVFFYGVNSKLETLAVHISRRPNGYVHGSLLLRFPDGKIYTIPEEHALQKEITELYTFGSARFKAQCSVPFRKWRIFFNGIVKETSSENAVPHYKHVSFVFLWVASSEVFDYYDWISPKVLSKAAASPSSLMSFPLFILQKMRGILDCYEQPGMLRGAIKIGGEDREMYLWGLRGRYRGSKDVVEDSKILQIYGTFRTGAIIHLESRYIPGISSRFIFGYVQKSNGFIHPIEDYKEIMIGDKTRFTFQCDKEKCLFDVENKSLYKTNFEREFGNCMDVEQKSMVLNGVEGRGLVFSGLVKEPTVAKLPKTKVSFIAKCGHVSQKVPLTVPFHDPCCKNHDLTGGKGSSLGKLHAISKETDAHSKKPNFEVPLGIVVTTEAYKEFIKGELEISLKKFEKAIWCGKDADVQALCKIMSEKVSKASLPEKIMNSVVKDLQHTFGGRWETSKFAVRSSATGEDTAQMSAAGQMETFLGMKGKDQIFDAVKKCWASQFFIHPVQYKRRYGRLLNMPMAVVIQEMVPCEVAGVLFTCDPVSGSPEFLSISANYGLGESVVSASAEPDTITIRRDINNRLMFHSETVGQKKSKIVMDADGSGTKEVEIEDPKAVCCLKKSAALKLAEIAVQIEEEFGDPRDIEWGIAHGKIYLFQSRPVTSIDTETEFEAKHFFDSHLRCEEEYVTKANVGEVVPGAFSPLSNDFYQKTMITTTARQQGITWGKNTGPECAYCHKAVSYAYNHEFINLLDGFMSFFDETSNDSKAMMIAIFGRIIDERDKITRLAAERHKPVKQSFFAKMYDDFIMFLVMFFTTFYLKIASKDVEKEAIDYKTEQNPAHLLNKIGKTTGYFWKVYHAHFCAITASSKWNLQLLTLLAEAEGVFDNNVYSDFAYLLSTCSQLESADVPSAVQNLGCTIAKCIDPVKFREMKWEEALNWLHTTKSEAGVKFRDFLKRHGHRCYKEFELYSSPWEWDQKPLVKMLQAFMSGNIKEAEEKKQMSYSEIFANLHVKLDFMSRLKLRILVPNCRRCVWEREAAKSLFIKSSHAYRKPLHKLAELMVQEGRLPRKDLLFFLAIEEINQLIKTRSPRLVAKAIKRYGYHEEMDKYMFPEIVCGIPQPCNIYEDYSEAVEGTSMTGFPVSQGVVKATARVVPTLEEATNIKPGDVLITYSTDIGWSPYFPLLSGVVTELGGLVSHGAVVAREYGLPCVVGLHGAVKVFKSGDIVVLDGTKGTIKKVGTESDS